MGFLIWSILGSVIGESFPTKNLIDFCFWLAKWLLDCYLCLCILWCLVELGHTGGMLVTQVLDRKERGMVWNQVQVLTMRRTRRISFDRFTVRSGILEKALEIQDFNFIDGFLGCLDAQGSHMAFASPEPKVVIPNFIIQWTMQV